MKWRHRKGRAGNKEDSQKPAVIEARHAAEESVDNLVVTQAQWPEIKALASRLATIREENNFAVRIQEAILGNQP